MNPVRLRQLVLGLNSLALLLYLLWMAGSGRPILYRREGVLSLLPCIPLFFVYLMLLGRPRNGKDPD